MSTDFLVQSLQMVFDKQPWYGKAILKIITPDLDPNARLGNGRHSVGQILRHMIAWRVFAIEKLKGNADFSIEADSQQDWDTANSFSAGELESMRTMLIQTQEELLSLIQQRSGSDWLNETVPGTKYKMGFLLQGIIHHDVYHAGQIALLNAGG